MPLFSLAFPGGRGERRASWVGGCAGWRARAMLHLRGCDGGARMRGVTLLLLLAAFFGCEGENASRRDVGDAARDGAPRGRDALQ